MPETNLPRAFWPDEIRRAETASAIRDGLEALHDAEAATWRAARRLGYDRAQTWQRQLDDMRDVMSVIEAQARTVLQSLEPADASRTRQDAQVDVLRQIRDTAHALATEDNAEQQYALAERLRRLTARLKEVRDGA